MQKNWAGRNVDLKRLTDRIGDFFKAKDFEAVKGEISLGYQILAEGSPYFRIDGYVSVNIEGKPNEFTVTLERNTKKKRPNILGSPFVGSFFLGYFGLKRLHSEEAWLKLQEEFWRHVENVVLQLTNTAQTSKQHVDSS